MPGGCSANNSRPRADPRPSPGKGQPSVAGSDPGMRSAAPELRARGKRSGGISGNDGLTAAPRAGGEFRDGSGRSSGSCGGGNGGGNGMGDEGRNGMGMGMERDWVWWKWGWDGIWMGLDVGPGAGPVGMEDPPHHTQPQIQHSGPLRQLPPLLPCPPSSSCSLWEAAPTAWPHPSCRLPSRGVNPGCFPSSQRPREDLCHLCCLFLVAQSVPFFLAGKRRVRRAQPCPGQGFGAAGSGRQSQNPQQGMTILDQGVNPQTPWRGGRNTSWQEEPLGAAPAPRCSPSRGIHSSQRAPKSP